jgi:hypothetical protein
MCLPSRGGLQVIRAADQTATSRERGAGKLDRVLRNDGVCRALLEAATSEVVTALRIYGGRKRPFIGPILNGSKRGSTPGVNALSSSSA